MDFYKNALTPFLKRQSYEKKSIPTFSFMNLVQFLS
jgi:hypothetical protein